MLLLLAVRLLLQRLLLRRTQLRLRPDRLLARQSGA